MIRFAYINYANFFFQLLLFFACTVLYVQVIDSTALRSHFGVTLATYNVTLASSHVPLILHELIM